MSESSEHTSGTDERAAELSASERHSLFAADRRRLAIDILAGRSSPVELEGLAARITARGNGSAADEESIERVAITLHHTHLPKMAEMGVVDYDPESRTVASEFDVDRLT